MAENGHSEVAATNHSSEENQKEFNHVVAAAQDVLYTAESIFPFVLFPDTITLSRMKVEIIRRAFFRVAESISLQIEDILNVEADTGPFFGSLRIYTRIYGTDPLRINFISSHDATKMKRLIEGSVIAKNNNIDVTEMDKEKLVEMLEHLGSNERQ